LTTDRQEKGPRNPIYIVYDQSDLPVANRLAEHLEHASFPCLLAAHDQRSEERSVSVNMAIESASCIVLILSDRANRSERVRSEVGQAYRIGKPIFPVRVEDTLPGPELELFISAKHWIDAWKGTLDQHAAHLARELSGELGWGEPVPALPWYRQRLWQQAALAIVLVSAVAATITYWTTRDLRQLMSATYPASISFTGGYILPNAPNEVRFSIQDGSAAGATRKIGALRHLNALEIYNVIDIRKPELVFEGDPVSPSGRMGTSLGNKLSFTGLPAILISCLSYGREDTNETETVLEGFGFFAAGSLYGHKKFDVIGVGSREVIKGELQASCRELAVEYATVRIDRADFDKRVEVAATAPDAQSAPVQPPVSQQAVLTERENVVGTLAMSQAFNKRFCRGKAFAVKPDVEGIAAFREKHQITDAELEASNARWEPTYALLDERVEGVGCITYLENYVGHRLVVRTSTVSVDSKGGFPSLSTKPGIKF
jgi:hypothetical protein